MENQNINQKIEITKGLINSYSQYKNIITLKKENTPLFYNLINNISPQKNEKDIYLKSLYYLNINRLNNINYDINNLKNYDIFIYPYKKLLTEKDFNTYKIINKKPQYKNISVFQILKNCYKQHKISKVMFKNSLKIIERQKEIKKHNELCLYYSFWDKSHKTQFKKIPQLNSKVNNLINSYFKIVKSSNSKNTLKALNNQKDKRLRINIKGYSVLIKKKYEKIILNHIQKQNLNNYSKERLNKIKLITEKEFNLKFTNDNKTI